MPDTLLLRVSREDVEGFYRGELVQGLYEKIKDPSDMGYHPNLLLTAVIAKDFAESLIAGDYGPVTDSGIIDYFRGLIPVMKTLNSSFRELFNLALEGKQSSADSYYSALEKTAWLYNNLPGLDGMDADALAVLDIMRTRMRSQIQVANMLYSPTTGTEFIENIVEHTYLAPDYAVKAGLGNLALR